MTKAIPSVILGGMKTKEFHFRLSGGELKRIQKAAGGYKSTAAFLLSSANERIRYRKVIVELKRYDRMFKKAVVMRVFDAALKEAAEKLKVESEG